MPLLDHFRPPLCDRRNWPAFLSMWATRFSAGLNVTLPEGYFAEQAVQFPDQFQVKTCYDTAWGKPQLAGAVELVSPANKDRPAHREAFVTKCAAYIQAGVGVVLVDVVTERSADFHRELMERLGATGTAPTPLFASAYRPVERDGSTALDVWLEPAALGQPLPTMPLWLRGGLCLPVELEATYERTCTEQRLRLVVG